MSKSLSGELLRNISRVLRLLVVTRSEDWAKLAKVLMALEVNGLSGQVRDTYYIRKARRGPQL